MCGSSALLCAKSDELSNKQQSGNNMGLRLIFVYLTGQNAPYISLYITNFKPTLCDDLPLFVTTCCVYGLASGHPQDIGLSSMCLDSLNAQYSDSCVESK